jgi:hypothetical protein
LVPEVIVREPVLDGGQVLAPLLAEDYPASDTATLIVTEPIPRLLDDPIAVRHGELRVFERAQVPAELPCAPGRVTAPADERWGPSIRLQ